MTQRSNIYPPRGDVSGPPLAIDSEIAVYDGDSGKLIKASGYTVAEVIALSSSNIDGGFPDSVYGGTTGMDGGGP